MKVLKGQDILALGFMTFALFVGAGNIIFPPIVGLQAGPHVWMAAQHARDDGMRLIGKPFTREQLARKVAEVLGAPTRAAPTAQDNAATLSS